MDRPHYKFEYSLPSDVYLFLSEGRHGSITKMVKFHPIQDDLVNLGFGDRTEDGCDFDDLIVTDNGDMELVLSTVIEITVKFLSLNPGVSIYLTGSTEPRTRLYRIIISNNYDIISKKYSVWGYQLGLWWPFEKNVNYEAFLISNLL